MELQYSVRASMLALTGATWYQRHLGKQKVHHKKGNYSSRTHALPLEGLKFNFLHLSLERFRYQNRREGGRVKSLIINSWSLIKKVVILISSYCFLALITGNPFPHNCKWLILIILNQPANKLNQQIVFEKRIAPRVPLYFMNSALTCLNLNLISE